jgi:hypothetical protein
MVMNEPINDFPSNEEKDNFWNTDVDSILFFNKTKKECKQCLDKILIEYSELIKRMKYV